VPVEAGRYPVAQRAQGGVDHIGQSDLMQHRIHPIPPLGAILNKLDFGGAGYGYYYKYYSSYSRDHDEDLEE
jgi:hypothetical protein